MEEPLLPMPAEKAGREPGPERVRAGECETKLLARPDARRALTSRGRPSSLSPSISPHRNPAFFRLLSEPGFAADPASCPAPHAGPGWALVTAPAFLYKKGKSPSAPTIDPFSRLARTGGAILAAAALAAAALAATLILGFRRHAGALTAAVVRLQVLVPAIAGGVALFAGAPGAAVGLFLVAALAAWAIHLWRAEIGLCARLLGLAASCVADVPGLLAASAACAAAGALFATVFGGAAVAALANGSLVANPAVVAAANVGAACADAAGAAIPCCSWSPAPYAPPLPCSPSPRLPGRPPPPARPAPSSWPARPQPGGMRPAWAAGAGRPHPRPATSWRARPGALQATRWALPPAPWLWAAPS